MTVSPFKRKQVTNAHTTPAELLDALTRALDECDSLRQENDILRHQLEHERNRVYDH